MINSLIIGFGFRVKNMIIPALKTLNDGNISIYSRNYEKLISKKNEYSFEPVQEINNDLFTTIDRIFISIPNNSILETVKKITKFHTKNINLYIDTPVVPKIKNINIKKYINNFKNIFILEDYYFNPVNDIVKNIIKKNQLSSIKKIEHINNGYDYHSLAQARDLCNKNKIFYGSKINDIQNYFFSKCKLKIIGSRKNSGYTKIETIRDLIIINKPEYNSNFNLDYIYRNNVLSGYKLNDKKIELEKNLQKDFINMSKICIKFDISSNIIQEQIISLVNLVRESHKEYGKKYFLKDGITDSFIIAVTRKFKIFFDLYLLNRSIFYKTFIIIFYIIYMLKRIYNIFKMK